MALLFRETFKCIEDAVRAGIYRNRRAVTPEDHAVAVEHEERALGDPFAGAVGAVGLRYGSLRLEIGEQREMQVAVLGESLVTPRAVDRDAEQFGVVLAK